MNHSLTTVPLSEEFDIGFYKTSQNLQSVRNPAFLIYEADIKVTEHGEQGYTL